MPFSWFLAIRYLKPKRSFLSIITIISVLGVMLGVGVLLVVISVMSGFEKRIKDHILEFTEPVKIMAPERGLVSDLTGEAEKQPEWQRVMALVKQQQGVQSVSPVVTMPALFDRKLARGEEGDTAVAQGLVVGVDPDDARQLERLQKHMEGGDGMLDLTGGQVVMTSDLVNRTGVMLRQEEQQTLDAPLGMEDQSAVLIYASHFLAEWQQRHRDDRALAEVEDEIRALGGTAWRDAEKVWKEGVEKRRKEAEAAGNDPPAEPEMQDPADGPPSEELTKLRAREKRYILKDRKEPAPEELQLAGAMPATNRFRQTAFVSMSTAQSLAGAGRGIDYLALSIDDAYRVGELKLALQPLLPEGWEVRTWTEENQQYFDAIANERGMMYLVLLAIIVVAAFCITNTTIVMAVQKRREIGLMRALGAKTSQIIALFTNNGIVIGIMGVTMGYIGGNVFLHYRNEIRTWIGKTFNWQIFDPAIYGLTELPAEARVGDHLFICGVAFLLCAVAALIPAWVVARLDPARALRTDR